MLSNQLSLKSLVTKTAFIFAAGFSVASYADTCPSSNEIKIAQDGTSGNPYYYTDSGWKSESSVRNGAAIQFLFMVGIDGDGPGNVGCAYQANQSGRIGLRNLNQPAATPTVDSGSKWQTMPPLSYCIADMIGYPVDPVSCPFTSISPPAVDIFSSPFGKKPISKK